MEEVVKRGFLVNEAYCPQLCKLPEKVRHYIIGAAFDKCFGLKTEGKIKDECGFMAATIAIIVQKAQEFDQNESERKAKAATRKAKWRSRHEKSEDGTGTERDGTGTERDGTGTERDGTGRNVPALGRPKAERAEMNRNEMTRIEENITPKSPAGAGDLEEEIDFPQEVQRVALMMVAAHPHRGGDVALVERAIRTVCPKGYKKTARLDMILSAHRHWVDSGVWEKDGGKWCPRLNRWIVEGGWQDEPREYEEPKAKVVEEPEYVEPDTVREII